MRPLHDVSLTLRAGEIVGIAGVSGNGQRELADVVAGVLVAESGTHRGRRRSGRATRRRSACRR